MIATTCNMQEPLDINESERYFKDHVRRHAAEARLRYGFYIDADVIVRMLSNPQVVRYATALDFDSGRLEPGEFAWAEQVGNDPGEGFRLHVHACFASQEEIWPLLIAYHIPSINYGEIVTPEHAELYGATLLGLDVETYYRALCELADSIPQESSA